MNENSPPDRAPVAGISPPSSKAAATNSPASRWKGNTRTGRRCRDLFRAFMAQAGNPDDPAMQAAILAASEQTVLAEIARSECLADGGMTKNSLELVIRAENLASRTLRRLKLDKPVSTKRTGPSLADIRAKYATPASETGA
jgi:hypothetical protein